MDSVLRDDWKKLWKSCKGNIYQSVEKIEINEKDGAVSVIFSIYSDNELKAGLCLFERVISLGPVKKKILEAHGTPLYTDKSSLIDLLRKIKRESKNYFYVTIAPTILFKEGEIFIKEGYSKEINHTVLLDLKKSKEELWKSFEKKSIKWGIKTAEKNKLIFAEAKDNGIENFYSLYEKTAETGNFSAESKEFIEKAVKSDFAKLFIVEYNKKMLAGGLLMIDFNNKISTLNLTSASEEGLKMQAMPFLYWKMIEYSKDIGMNIFDMGGYDNEAREGDKTYNINKFKERFGGNLTEQEIFSSKKIYSNLRKIMRKMAFIKKMYNKK